MTGRVSSIGWTTLCLMKVSQIAVQVIQMHPVAHFEKSMEMVRAYAIRYIWGNSIFYSTNSDNCTVMAFDNNMANPNFKLTFPQSGSMSVVKLGSTMIPLLMFIVTAATI